MISQNDPCFHFYVPQTFHGKTFPIKLRVRDEYELEQDYLIKESQKLNAPIQETNQSLLKQPISDLLTEIAIDQMELEEQKQPEIIHSAHNLLINKYTPQKFSELLSEERINREVLMWLQVWKQKDQKSQIHHFFRNNVQQYDNPLNMKMANQILLLAGPPGTGKTTLARVIGKMCGFDCNEINASDERTADKLIDRMEMMTQYNSLTKPTLIIMDEIDGALESESDGAVNKLLEYVFYGKKKKNIKKKVKDKDKEDQDNETQELFIKRPVIFICNDPYAKGLRELRKKAWVYYFKPPEDNQIIARLKYICSKENIQIDHSNLMKICQSNNNDIRACLGVLQIIKLDPRYAENQTQLYKSKGVLELLADYFFLQNQLPDQSIDFTQLNLIMDATFGNYLSVKSVSKKFQYLPKFIDQLCWSDIFQRDKLKYQFQLEKYVQLPLIYFKNYFRTYEKSRLTFPIFMSENRRKYKATQDIIEQVKPQIKKRFSSEMVSYIYRIMQPKAEMSIMTQDEKKDLKMALSVMKSFNLTLLETPIQFALNEKQIIEINFQPQIERLISYKDIPLFKKLSEKTRILMLNLLPGLSKQDKHVLDMD